MKKNQLLTAVFVSAILVAPSFANEKSGKKSDEGSKTNHHQSIERSSNPSGMPVTSPSPWDKFMEYMGLKASSKGCGGKGGIKDGPCGGGIIMN